MGFCFRSGPHWWPESLTKKKSSKVTPIQQNQNPIKTSIIDLFVHTFRRVKLAVREREMASAGEKRGRDDVDDKLNNTVEVTSSDEDDDDDCDSEPAFMRLFSKQLTEAELSEYYSRSFSSNGFDVPEFGYALAGGIRLMKLGGRYDELVCDFAKQALQVYNNQNNANFEFDHLVKANIQAVSGFMYYITFTARSGDNALQTFCGKVWQKVMKKGTEVKFCVMATD
ncbi:uncharacterized protein [Arachis hypogaea]|uniref:uncharacterized protein n=1 Tax=Arachis hypogaea TaxID=3818 RepID=UPI0034E6BE2A